MKTQRLYALLITMMSEHHRQIFQRWEAGEDLKRSLSHATFFRHKKAILNQIGVDISQKRRNLSEPYKITVLVNPVGEL